MTRAGVLPSAGSNMMRETVENPEFGDMVREIGDTAGKQVVALDILKVFASASAYVVVAYYTHDLEPKDWEPHDLEPKEREPHGWMHCASLNH